MHLLGFALITGGAFVSNLRLLWVLLREEAVATVTRPAARGIAIGLLISAATGFLLFAQQAPEASVNATFRLKMLLLASAVEAVGLFLWTGVGVAGASYILLE